MDDNTTADAGLKRKRETQRDRVVRAIDMAWDNTPVERRLCCELFADAAIGAMPEPRTAKERDRPKRPTDYCRLHAMRHEFVALVEFIEARAENGMMPGSDGPLALVRALREQGVV